MLELDHVFCFVSPQLDEADEVMRAGYVLTAERRHQGQGTANRSVLFQRNYLELLYLTDRTQAQDNPLRLDRHADGMHTGFAPFGVGLRGSIEMEDRRNFWDYQPEYGAEGFILPVHRSQQVGGPVVFQVPGAKPPSRWPDAGPLMQHRRHTAGIARVVIEGPGVVWPLSETVEGIEFRQADAFRMVVRLHGRQSEPTLQVNELLTIE